MSLVSLRAKGVRPHASTPARLPGWQLLFNVHHWFRHEGGVGNIRPSTNPDDEVRGVVHVCEDEHLALMDAVESYGVGYDRIEVDLETEAGPTRAVTYVGIPTYLDDSCLPTRRYLNILVKGAVSAGIDGAYVEKLRQHPVYVPDDYPVFEHPAGAVPEFTKETLAEHPLYTAVAGAVFDMEAARWQHHCLRGLFGGRDMTLFHLKRLDDSDGSECLDDLRTGRLNAKQRTYLNEYLNEYDAEYRYVGRYRY